MLLKVNREIHQWIEKHVTLLSNKHLHFLFLFFLSLLSLSFMLPKCLVHVSCCMNSMRLIFSWMNLQRVFIRSWKFAHQDSASFSIRTNIWVSLSSKGESYGLSSRITEDAPDESSRTVHEVSRHDWTQEERMEIEQKRGTDLQCCSLVHSWSLKRWADCLLRRNLRSST